MSPVYEKNRITLNELGNSEHNMMLLCRSLFHSLYLGKGQEITISGFWMKVSFYSRPVQSYMDGYTLHKKVKEILKFSRCFVLFCELPLILVVKSRY